MWPKAYRDYTPQDPLIKEQRLPGRGIIGCEMHEQNSWGDMELPERPKAKAKTKPKATSHPKAPGFWKRLWHKLRGSDATGG